MGMRLIIHLKKNALCPFPDAIKKAFLENISSIAMNEMGSLAVFALKMSPYFTLWNTVGKRHSIY